MWEYLFKTLDYPFLFQYLYEHRFPSKAISYKSEINFAVD